MNIFTRIVLILFCLSAGAQASPADTTRLTVMFYNTDNLYDTENDPGVDDEEFLPSSGKLWDETRYMKKVEDVGKVLCSLPDVQLPDIVGVCEVENRKVLDDLTRVTCMAKGGYSFIHRDSPDKRGLDVALLYRTSRFTPLKKVFIPSGLPSDTIPACDILYVSGSADDGTILHLFVNHWASRENNVRGTERRRLYAAVKLRKTVDSILNTEPLAQIIIMGDFNDEPTNMSLHSILNASNKRRNASGRDLYNLMYDRHNMNREGTYNHKGNWLMTDQIIVSQALLTGEEPWITGYDDGRILRHDWLLTDNPKVGMPVPNLTFSGNKYFGGPGDHLPVYVVLTRTIK